MGAGDVNTITTTSVQTNFANRQFVIVNQQANDFSNLAVIRPEKKIIHFFSKTTKSVSSERLRHKKAYERDITLLHNFRHQLIFVFKESSVTFPDSPLLQSTRNYIPRRGPPAIA
jgi:hypothetical protein